MLVPACRTKQWSRRGETQAGLDVQCPRGSLLAFGEEQNLGARERVMQSPQTSDVVDEIGRFQGTWRQTEWEISGVSNPSDEFGTSAVTVIAGQTFVVTRADGGVVIKGFFAIDPTQEPKAVDWTDTFGVDAGKTFPGIYSLVGDQLIFCVSDEGQERPKQFRTQLGQVLRVLQREKA
jgi:uncharacterized protein (TIGR03067 family)